MFPGWVGTLVATIVPGGWVASSRVGGISRVRDRPYSSWIVGHQLSQLAILLDILLDLEPLRGAATTISSLLNTPAGGREAGAADYDATGSIAAGFTAVGSGSTLASSGPGTTTEAPATRKPLPLLLVRARKPAGGGYGSVGSDTNVGSGTVLESTAAGSTYAGGSPFAGGSPTVYATSTPAVHGYETSTGASPSLWVYTISGYGTGIFYLQ
ncbi:hypothetical protein SUGI_0350800 [Cryptomeria japonica]|nr:hypothetical protein SUGI_0350800 [Cryptomeria japonica]